MKAVAGKYTLLCEDGQTVVCSVRGKVKKDIDVYVGDDVTTDGTVLSEVLPRKNCLIRPYVANIDKLYIVVAPTPEPDWVLVEKLLLNCRKEGIATAIVLNKTDLGEEPQWLEPYLNETEVYRVSVKTGEGTEALLASVRGVVCFAGQSAVGKTSLIGALCGKELEVGELSKKIARGKNTTRQIEIFPCGEGYAVDTCGFSVADSIDIRPEELVYYYDDFVAVQGQCRFNNCTHVGEPGCKVKQLLSEGKFNRNRYDRYVKLYRELSERRKTLYG